MGNLFMCGIHLNVIQEAYTGEITQERRSFKATFEAVTSPRRKWAALAAVTTVLDYIASSFSSHDRDKYM